MHGSYSNVKIIASQHNLRENLTILFFSCVGSCTWLINKLRAPCHHVINISQPILGLIFCFEGIPTF